MPCGYISSNDERLYVAQELNYGQVSTVTSQNRFPAVKLAASQKLVRPKRKDKTGTRTFPGSPAGLRTTTTFDVTTYMTGWTQQNAAPGYGPLFQAGLGGAPIFFGGGTAGTSQNPKLLAFASPHGLAPGQAVTCGGELRFAIAIVDPLTVELNAPFTALPAAGAAIGATVTYGPATDLGSLSIYDYWSPADAVQRILSGAAVDKIEIKVNGDYNEFEFSGVACDLIDSTSFQENQGGLESFPAEPALQQFDYSIIPGHLGQAWLDNTPDRFYTLTAAEVVLENNIDTRHEEFGSDEPRCLSAGSRTVTVNFELFELDNAATKGLYQAARQYSPIGVMLQLGQQAGQLFGVCLNSVVPVVPEFDDSETRLQWKFTGSQAQGAGNDEIYVAFG
jgi:hypothetical protein